MSEYFSYNYRQLHVAYIKLGEGPPMLLLHGWGSSSKVMLPLAKQFASSHTCYAIDLPGFGQTFEPSNPWNVDDYADLVESFILDHFDEPVDLLVHSFGGRIALKLCARLKSQQFINKVLITGGAGMKPKRSAGFYLKKYLAKSLKAPFQLLPNPQKEKSLQKLRQTSIWKWLGSSEYSELSGVMRQTFVLSVTEFLESCLPKIPQEVLLLWGKNDDATPLYQAERMESGIKRAALVVIENAGHYPFLDQPKRFASIARAFFEKQEKEL